MYIQDISNKTGLTKKAITLYEEKGFIYPQKDQLGYRVYTNNDLQTLQKIKILRSFDLSLAQIQKIIIEKDYTLLQQQRIIYQQKQYDIETSLQFLEDIENSLKNQKDDQELYQKIESVRNLKHIQEKDNIEFNFDQLNLILMMFAVGISLNRNEDIIIEIIVCIVCFIAMLIYFSSSCRLLVLKIIKKFKK